jgi:hypothetical protein
MKVQGSHFLFWKTEPLFQVFLPRAGLFLSLLVLIVSCSREHSPTNFNPAQEEVVWTILFYDNADFANAYDPLEHLAEYAYSSSNLNVVVYQDTEEDSIRFWYIDSAHQAIQIAVGEERNSGQQSTLQDFLNFGKQHYPADSYILAIYGHGWAYAGSTPDGSSDYDPLSNDELAQALLNCGGVDLLLFTAPCVMASIEALYEVRAATQIFIASENTSGYICWREAMGDLAYLLDHHSQLGFEIIAGNIIDAITMRSASLDSAILGGITMSALRTDGVEQLTNSLDQLCESYRLNLNHFVPLMDSVFFNVTRLAPDLVDLGSMLTELRLVETDSLYSSRLDSSIYYLEQLCIQEYHGLGFNYLGGLNIYFPTPALGYSPLYASPATGLDFCTDTRWDQLLNLYCRRSSLY